MFVFSYFQQQQQINEIYSIIFSIKLSAITGTSSMKMLDLIFALQSINIIINNYKYIYILALLRCTDRSFFRLLASSIILLARSLTYLLK